MIGRIYLFISLYFQMLFLNVYAVLITANTDPNVYHFNCIKVVSLSLLWSMFRLPYLPWTVWLWWWHWWACGIARHLWELFAWTSSFFFFREHCHLTQKYFIFDSIFFVQNYCPISPSLFLSFTNYLLFYILRPSCKEYLIKGFILAFYRQ